MSAIPSQRLAEFRGAGPEPAPASRGRFAAADPVPSFDLRLEGVSKKWRRGPLVLDDVDLLVPGGTSVWIGGANGVGKTTLLRIATAAILPDRGRVSLGGLDPEKDRKAFHRRMAYLAAGDRALYARLSVRRHLDLWGCLALLDRDRRHAAIDRALDHFQLRELANRRADRMSLGQRQRLRLAGAFLHDPAIAMLDEPHNSLDDDGLAMLAEACTTLVARGGTVVWCSPSPDQANLDFDSSYRLCDGKLRPE